MSLPKSKQIPDNTLVLIGAGQYTQRLKGSGTPLLNAAMELAAKASEAAINDAGGALCANDIDAIAVTRLFSDSVPAWACPFGRSNNPPQSVAQRLGAAQSLGTAAPLDFNTREARVIDSDDIDAIEICDTPSAGTILTYTVIFERKRDDMAVVMAQSDDGERFLANSTDPATVAAVLANCPIDSRIKVEQAQAQNRFSLEGITG